MKRKVQNKRTKKEKAERQQKLVKIRKKYSSKEKFPKKYGKNAILKGMNLQEGATTVDRNNQIGGHKA